jgi:hypothetical protein
MAKKTILNAVVERINNTKDCDVFLRKDFLDLGSYAQIGNCLRQLCQEQKLRRFGQGLYARTTVATTPPFEGEIYVKKGLVGMDGIAAEALRRLGYEVVPTQADRDYNERRSTQVPTGRRLAIKGRRKVSRKIGYEDVCVTYEYFD